MFEHATPRQPGDSLRLREDILWAAARIFRLKGYQRGSSEEIAAALDIPKATLFYHVKSKERILYAISERVTAEGVRRVGAILSKEGDTRMLLREAVVEHVRIIEEFGDWVAVVYEEMKHLPDEMFRRAVEDRQRYRQQWEAFLERGVARGEFCTADVEVISLFVLGLLNGIYRWYAPGGRCSAEEVGSTAARLILDGLVPTGNALQDRRRDDLSQGSD